jgi:hypothetical protein
VRLVSGFRVNLRSMTQAHEDRPAKRREVKRGGVARQGAGSADGGSSPGRDEPAVQPRLTAAERTDVRVLRNMFPGRSKQECASALRSRGGELSSAMDLLESGCSVDPDAGIDTDDDDGGGGGGGGSGGSHVLAAPMSLASPLPGSTPASAAPPAAAARSADRGDGSAASASASRGRGAGGDASAASPGPVAGASSAAGGDSAQADGRGRGRGRARPKAKAKAPVMSGGREFVCEGCEFDVNRECCEDCKFERARFELLARDERRWCGECARNHDAQDAAGSHRPGQDAARTLLDLGMGTPRRNGPPHLADRQPTRSAQGSVAVQTQPKPRKRERTERTPAPPAQPSDRERERRAAAELAGSVVVAYGEPWGWSRCSLPEERADRGAWREEMWGIILKNMQPDQRKYVHAYSEFALRNCKGCIQPISRCSLESGQRYHLVRIGRTSAPPRNAADCLGVLEWNQQPPHSAVGWLSCMVAKRPAHVKECPVRPACHVFTPAPSVALVPSNPAEFAAAVGALTQVTVVLLDQELKDVSRHLHVGEPTVKLVGGVAVATWATMAVTQISSRVVPDSAVRAGSRRVVETMKAAELLAKRGSSSWCAVPRARRGTVPLPCRHVPPPPPPLGAWPREALHPRRATRGTRAAAIRGTCALCGLYSARARGPAQVPYEDRRPWLRRPLAAGL